MKRIYAKLTPAQVEAIVRISEAERRHPSDQLAVVVDRYLAERAPKEKEVTTAR